MLKWIAGKAAEHDNNSSSPERWSVGKKWGLLEASDKAKYIAWHAGLAVKTLPLVGVSILTSPLSLASIALDRLPKNADKPSQFTSLFSFSMLLMAPVMMAPSYRKLGEWLEDQARAAARRDDPAIPESPRANMALGRAAWAGDLQRIRGALKAGANPSAVLDDGDTPLIIACIVENQACVEALLAAGANPNAISRNGRRALDHAARRSSVAIGQMLISAGAALEDPEAERVSKLNLGQFAKQGPQPGSWMSSMRAAAQRRDGLAEPSEPLGKLAARRAAKGSAGPRKRLAATASIT